MNIRKPTKNKTKILFTPSVLCSDSYERGNLKYCRISLETLRDECSSYSELGVTPTKRTLKWERNVFQTKQISSL